MARSRNIKPGFFKNELLGQADPMLSLLFVGLWTLSDRRGILEDRPLRIKAELFPYRDITDIAGYLTELERLGFLERFTAKGVALIHIPTFAKHQSPHPTEKPNEFPGIEEKDEQKQDAEQLPVKKPLDNGGLHVVATLNPYSLKDESRKQQRKPRGFLLSEFLEACKQNNEPAISGYKPLWDYTEKVGIPKEWVVLAWRMFRRKFADDKKRYLDWRHTFRNYVENNWLKLWTLDASGQCLMTSTGFAELKHSNVEQEAA